MGSGNASGQEEELRRLRREVERLEQERDFLKNAVAESFFATLRWELLDRHQWPTRALVRSAIFEYIEIWYNRQRRHSTLDYLSPWQYEQRILSRAA
jgi:transposase InsO family protein